MKLSVCVTTYKRAALLDKTLASLAAQTRQPDELIVSDDCSPDNTAEVVARWEKRFPQLIYSRNERNLYMPGNLNAAVSRAQGEYIANLHDADEFDPTLLEKWERALDTYPSAGFVFNGVIAERSMDGSPKTIYLHDVEPFTHGREFFEKHLLHKFSSIVWGTTMARRSAYERLMPFDAEYSFISDVDMWMRMCLYFDVAYVREPLIILDNSPAKERGFNWKRVEVMRRMQVANIQRFYKDAPTRLQNELIQQQRVARRYYLRRILGRAWHLDSAGVYDGIRLLLQVFKPTNDGVLA